MLEQHNNSTSMKKYISLTLFVLAFPLFNSAFGQYISHYTERDRIKMDTLLDKKVAINLLLISSEFLLRQLLKMENCYGRPTRLLTTNLKDIEATGQQLYIFPLVMRGKNVRRK